MHYEMVIKMKKDKNRKTGSKVSSETNKDIDIHLDIFQYLEYIVSFLILHNFQYIEIINIMNMMRNAYLWDHLKERPTSGRAVPLSEDHKPSLRREQDRVERAGGVIIDAPAGPNILSCPLQGDVAFWSR